MAISSVGGSQGNFEVPEDEGAQEPTAAAAPETATVSRTSSSASNTVPLTTAHKNKILGDAEKLGDAGIRKHPTSMPLGIEFASIDASKQLGAMGSVSFGHKVTILVPQGPLVPSPTVKHDPNKATEYYVQMGASTNTKAGFYGPFKIK